MQTHPALERVKLKVFGIQTKITRHAKKQTSVTPNKEKNEPMETNPEKTKMMEFVGKGQRTVIKTTFHTFEKVKIHYVK